MIKNEIYELIHNYCCWFDKDFAVANGKGFLSIGVFITVIDTLNLFSEMKNRGYEYLTRNSGAIYFEKVN